MKINVLIAVSVIILIAGAFYLCYPKYEIYQSAGGMFTYRFNKITGVIQVGDPKSGEWSRVVPAVSIQKQ